MLGASIFIDFNLFGDSIISVVVLDHHKTAKELLGGGTSETENVSKVIDMDRSGATISYDYFKEKLITGNNNEAADGNAVKIGEFDRVRRLFEYIEDRDLWRWKLPDSKAFSSGLDDRHIEYDVNLNPSLFQQVVSTCRVIFYHATVLLL